MVVTNRIAWVWSSLDETRYGVSVVHIMEHIIINEMVDHWLEIA